MKKPVPLWSGFPGQIAFCVIFIFCDAGLITGFQYLSGLAILPVPTFLCSEKVAHGVGHSEFGRAVVVNSSCQISGHIVFESRRSMMGINNSLQPITDIPLISDIPRASGIVAEQLVMYGAT
jgi:hypothetical protein